MTITNSTTFRTPGTADPDFGEEGQIYLWQMLGADPKFVYYLFKGIAASSSGKLILSGQVFENGSSKHLLTQVNSDGSLDKSFAENGFYFGQFAPGVNSAGGKLVIQGGSEHIFMLGWVENATGWADLGILCLDKDGTPVTSFANEGTLIIQTPSDLELLTDSWSIVAQPDNKLLIAINYAKRGDPQKTTGVLLRLLPDGKPDTTFNRSGRWEFKLEDPSAATRIGGCLIQGQYIVIAGHAQLRQGKDTAVFGRVKGDGKVDITFGDPQTPGFHFVQLPGYTTRLNALTERTDGSLIGAGGAIASGSEITNGLLVALTPAGLPHQLFNRGKPLISRIDPANDNNGWLDVLAQSDNKFAVNVQAWPLIARYMSDGNLDQTFNGTGFTEPFSFNRTPPGLMAARQDGRIIVTGNIIGVVPEGVGFAKCFLS